MRIDAHQHFWRYEPEEYAWISEPLAALRRDFLPEDLQPLLAAHGIDGCVAVQARQTVAESDWLLELADASRIVRGVVGWVDLRDPGAEAELARLAAHPRFVGVRHIAQDEPDDGFLARPDFVAGVAKLAPHGLRYDLLVYERQLPAAIELVSALPGQPFVLDHLGKPCIADGMREPWAGNLVELARRENVQCKVSGLVTEAAWDAWTLHALRQYLDTALEAFGPGRLMFGSDWPVCLLAGDYPAVYELVEHWSAALSTAERAALFGGNAARFYGLTRED
ncbi:MAG: amidohydrolase family protein [Planctomycetes bacterium]|nr:amidohydrolase family protein [Planctomycetota bacterium]